jgi:hypothetical protein
MRRKNLVIAATAGLVVILTAAGAFGFRSPQASHSDVGVVIAAAGDIACDPAYPTFNAGQGTLTGCHEKATSDAVLKIDPKAVLAVGDIQYVHGTASNYAASYDPTWGRFKSITYPAIGNHEGGEGGKNTTYFDYFGARAGARDAGYYSFDIGAWHMIALNSNCGEYSFNGSHAGCEAGSTQEVWLKQDLAAHTNKCILAYFHVPRFSSGADHHSDASTDNTLDVLWQDLYAGGVDVVLNGHAHEYERFAPLRPDGSVDDAKGVREFIVGTGGDNDNNSFGKPISGSVVRDNTSFGVLKMTLLATSYEWQFVNDGSPGATNNDQGAAACH